MSKNAIARVLINAGYNGRIASKKFFVSEVNTKKRLQFAKHHVSKGSEFWNKVIFSDERKVNAIVSDGW